MKLELEVTDCRDCVCNKSFTKKGGKWWHECHHPEIISQGIKLYTHGWPETWEQIPEKCPILKGVNE